MIRKTLLYWMVLLLSVSETDCDAIRKNKISKRHSDPEFVRPHRKIYKTYELNHHPDSEGRSIPYRRTIIYPSDN